MRIYKRFGDAPVLSQGDSGSAVQVLQTDLNALGYGPLTVDGQFGPATEAAVNAYQMAQGLTASGQADQATWDALSASPLSQPTPTSNTSTGTGSNTNVLSSITNWLSNPLPSSSGAVTSITGQASGGMDWKLIAAISALGLGGVVLTFGLVRGLFKKKATA